MPTTLPDPVLALSLANLQKLNAGDVDQLANLWNLFSKCKESLESGRRLENLSWRMWFREAHVLPPDTSLSDLADFTPLGSPLMSRRNSFNNGNQQSTRILAQTPSTSLTQRALQAAAAMSGSFGSTIPSTANALSDPEDGDDWSSDEDERGEASLSSTQIEQQQQQKRKASTSSAANARSRELLRSRQGSLSTAANPLANASSNAPIPGSSRGAIIPPNASKNLTVSPASRDNVVEKDVLARRRAVSSSSAFGSRARAKQSNLKGRRRPLSFQQAIRALLMEGEEDLSPRAFTAVQGQQSVKSLPSAANFARSIATASYPSVQSEKIISQSSAPADLLESKPSLSRKLHQQEQQEHAGPNGHSPKDNKNNKPFAVETSHDGSDAGRDEASKSFLSSSTASVPRTSLEQSSARPKHVRQAPSESSNDSARTQKTAKNTLHHNVRPALHGSRHAPMTAAARSKSSIGLARRNHGRGTSSSKLASANVKFAASPPKRNNHKMEDKARRTSLGDTDRASTAGTSKQKAAKQPVKFTMGSVGDRSSSDDEKIDEYARQSQAKTKTNVEVASDDWSSEASTDSETKKLRQDHQSTRAEQERLTSMFKKIPVRVQSTIDVRPESPKPMTNQEQVVGSQSALPARGLLSSIFNSEQGDNLVGRSHASVANLREKQQNIKPRKTSQPEGEESKSVISRFAASAGSVPYSGSGGLKLSKSAVALPVLSTTGSRSEVQGSRDTAVFEDDSSAEDEALHANDAGTSSSYAVDRLNELTQARAKARKANRRSSEQQRIDAVTASEKKNRNRNSKSSLDLRVHPDLDEEHIRQQRRTSAPMEAPSIAAPMNLPQRSRSAVNIADQGLPQSPRTTRRNMLRDELSESMRDYLLWERQSRNRMLGIGAPVPVVTSVTQRQNTNAEQRTSQRSMPPPQVQQSQLQSTSHGHFHRPQSVLGNTALRPLTARRSAVQDSNDADAPAPPSTRSAMREESRYSGDFHHAGW